MKVYIENEYGSGDTYWPDFYKTGDRYTCLTDANFTTISTGIVHESYFHLNGLCFMDTAVNNLFLDALLL